MVLDLTTGCAHAGTTTSLSARNAIPAKLPKREAEKDRMVEENLALVTPALGHLVEARVVEVVVTNTMQQAEPCEDLLAEEVIDTDHTDSM